MRLCEDLQEEIIEQYKILEQAFDNLKEEAVVMESRSRDNKNLNSDANYLLDFIKEELRDKMDYLKDQILEEYYPIDYADDEDDPIKAGERYRNSKEEREAALD